MRMFKRAQIDDRNRRLSVSIGALAIASLLTLPGIASAHDVLVDTFNISGANHFMADDFVPTRSGELTEIRFDTALKGDVNGVVTQIEVRLYDNDPTGAGSYGGAPGNLLWSRTYLSPTLGSVRTVPPQDWGDMWVPHEEWIEDDHTNETTIALTGISSVDVVAGTTYWVAINASVSPILPRQEPALGWKRGPYAGEQAMYLWDPDNEVWVVSSSAGHAHGIPAVHGLSFSTTIVPDPEVPYATFDMTGFNQFMADDFVPSMSGRLTEIQFDAAFKGDIAGEVTQIEVRLYDHDPSGASVYGGAPGSLLWSQTFASPTLKTPSIVPPQRWVDNWAPEWLEFNHTNQTTIALSGLSPINVMAGTTYWVAINASVMPLLPGQRPALGWKNAPQPWVGDSARYSYDLAAGSWAVSSLLDTSNSHGVPFPHDLAFTTTVEPQPDSDFDGIGDLADNCIHEPNGPVLPDAGGNVQLDTDGDGYGNACDCDFDQNGSCDIQDFNVFLPEFQAAIDSGIGTDMNGDGAVGVGDFNLFLPGFIAGVPGP